MNKKLKITILSLIIIAVGFLAIMEFAKIGCDIKKIQIPNKENRQLNNLDVNKWMTIKKISEKIGISENSIFEKLSINKETGDENIPIIDLMKKYNISDEDIKKALHDLLGDIKGEGGTNE